MIDTQENNELGQQPRIKTNVVAFTRLRGPRLFLQGFQLRQGSESRLAHVVAVGFERVLKVECMEYFLSTRLDAYSMS